MRFKLPCTVSASIFLKLRQLFLSPSLSTRGTKVEHKRWFVELVRPFEPQESTRQSLTSGEKVPFTKLHLILVRVCTLSETKTMRFSVFWNTFLVEMPFFSSKDFREKDSQKVFEKRGGGVKI